MFRFLWRELYRQTGWSVNGPVLLQQSSFLISLYYIKSLCRASYTYSGISITAMVVRPRNSNWALIVTGKHKLVNRTCQKFLFFTRCSYEIHTQHIEKVVLTAV